MAQQQVDISAMSLEQLNTYKGQFENEIKQLPVEINQCVGCLVER